VLAAVGPLQFDVVMHRLEHEFGAKSELAHLDYEIARLTDEAGVTTLAGARGAEVLARRLDGALLALFADKWRLNAIQRDNPSLRLDPLLAGTVTS
jgi:peptide chain release factor 3